MSFLDLQLKLRTSIRVPNEIPNEPFCHNLIRTNTKRDTEKSVLFEDSSRHLPNMVTKLVHQVSILSLIFRSNATIHTHFTPTDIVYFKWPSSFFFFFF
jgi:hypothetical protein